MSDLMEMFHRKPSNPDATGPEYVDEMPGASASVKRAITVSKTFPDTLPDGCYRCEQELYVSFSSMGLVTTRKSTRGRAHCRTSVACSRRTRTTRRKAHIDATTKDLAPA